MHFLDRLWLLQLEESGPQHAQSDRHQQRAQHQACSRLETAMAVGVIGVGVWFANSMTKSANRSDSEWTPSGIPWDFDRMPAAIWVVVKSKLTATLTQVLRDVAAAVSERL